MMTDTEKNKIIREYQKISEIIDTITKYVFSENVPKACDINTETKEYIMKVAIEIYKKDIV